MVLASDMNLDDKTVEILSRCRLCGHGCGADRYSGEIGTCGNGKDVKVARHLLHFGEEPPITGERGSGTIFFSGCVLSCAFCQNHQISRDGMGESVSVEDLSGMMLDLQAKGAHNINLVSPTPWAAHIAPAIDMARETGLSVPIVYNTGGFDSTMALSLMEGLVDVYLPDAKIAQAQGESGRNAPTRELARRLFGAANYVPVNRAALKEMFRQVGPLKMDDDGIAAAGLLVRHLVLPGNMANTDRVLAGLVEDFGPDVWVSLMAQYRPMARVLNEPEKWPGLNRPITEDEYDMALDVAVDLGMENVFVQEMSAVDTYVPDFESKDVFSDTR